MKETGVFRKADAAPETATALGLAALTGAVLGYFPLPSSWSAPLFAGGVVLPLAFAGWRLRRASAGKAGETDFFLGPWSPALWGSLGLAAVGLRFFKLTSFHAWPSGDEALQGYFAIDLLRKWSWHFFYTSGQHPPLLIWMLTLCFRLFQDPFFCLWCVPALFSALFLWAGYMAAREFFPEGRARVYFCLLAFGFWPLYFGRFCVQGALVPFFEMAAFWILGRLLKAGPRTSGPWTALLGLWTGLGTWTYTSWWVVVFFLLCLMVFRVFKSRMKPVDLLVFILFLLLGCLPWIAAVWKEGFGGYAWGISPLGGFYGWRDQALNGLSYLTRILGWPWGRTADYGPVWGGMLDPFLVFFFFMGAARAFRNRREEPAAAALPTVLLLFLLPGLLAADQVEMFRVVQAMPLILWVSADGLASFLSFFAPGNRNKILFLLLGLVIPLNFWHLMKTTSGDFCVLGVRFQHPVRDENYWAYRQIKPLEEKEGPGLVFCDFILLDHDHTLEVATYPFNALLNPALEGRGVRWAAVVTNRHYVPDLARRFPGSRWAPVTPYAAEDGGSAVGLLPIRPEDGPLFSSWAKADLYFHGLGIRAENLMNHPMEYRKEVSRLPDGYPLVEGDPYLESLFGEWAAQYHSGRNFQANILALRRAVEKGYPTANLFCKLGDFYYWAGDWVKAEGAYSRAVHCRPDYTNARQALMLLESEHQKHRPEGRRLDNRARRGYIGRSVGKKRSLKWPSEKQPP
jgi:Dolichyl-phosphate-mannose-protein mannosyltransferase